VKILPYALLLIFFAPQAAGLIVGIDYNYPPHEFIENGEARGFNVDIMRAIAAHMNESIEFKPMAWHEALDALKNGSIDALCMAKNEERRQYFDFSKPILDIKLAIFVNEEITGIASIEDLEGHTVAVEKGDIAEEILLNRGINAFIIEADTQDKAMKLLAEREVMAFFGNYYTGVYLVHKYGYKDIKVIGEAINVGERVIAVRKGNHELLEKINESIEAIKASGEYDAIYEKWYGVHVYAGKKIPEWIFLSIFALIAITAGGFTVMGIWSRTLTRKVRERTMELEELKNKLEEKVASKTAELRTIIFSLAHDLKAPLRSIKSFAAFLLEKYGGDKEAESNIRRILDAAERMEKQIDALLQYGKLEKDHIDIKRVDMNKLVNEVIAEMKDYIESKGAEIKIRKLPEVRGDKSILKSIMYNLIHNAVKFVEPGKKPVVEIYGEKNDRVKIFVKDNGIGISKNVEEDIFALFTKLHGREEYDGTGVGLAMVKKGVEMLGGKVGFESNENEGSIFWIELPF